MGDRYYIGKGHKKPRRQTFLLRATIVLAVLLALFLLFNHAFYPQIVAFADSAVTNRITALATEKASEVLAEGNYSYEELIRISYTADGRVAAISVDTVKLNLLRYRIATAILSELHAHDITVRIPLSNVFGIIFFNGWGESAVTVRCAESMTAGFVSSFTECGINQTRHSLMFQMEVTAYYLPPLFLRTQSILCSIPAAETVIVGEVPDSFTDISRLTDNISEIDIDDAVDFGNVVN